MCVDLPKLGAAAESDEQTLLYHPEATLLAISSHSPAPPPPALNPSAHLCFLLFSSSCSRSVPCSYSGIPYFHPLTLRINLKGVVAGEKNLHRGHRPHLLSQSHKHSVSVMLFGSDMLGEIKC